MTNSFRKQITRHYQLSQAAQIIRTSVFLVVAVATPLTLAAGLDYVLVLSPPWRWSAWILTTAGGLLTLLVGIHTYKRARRHAITAKMDAHSELPSGYVISTAAQLEAKAPSDPTEAHLLQHLQTAAEQLVHTAQPVHPWPNRYLVGIATFLMLAALTVRWQHGAHAFLRMLTPWKDMPYTEVSLLAIEQQPARNEPFELQGIVQGRIPEHAYVWLENGQRAEIPVEPDGTFSLSFDNGLAESTIAKAFAGADGRSLPKTIALRATPTRTQYQHQITAPAYTGHGQVNETRPSFSLLRASDLHFSVSFDMPATAVQMVFDTDRPPLDLQTSTDTPHTWYTHLDNLERTFGYHLEVSDTNGTYAVEDQAHQIVVTPDRPPSIEITAHNAEKITTPEDVVSIEYFTQDDIGLASVHMRYYRVGDPQPRTRRLASFPPMTRYHEDNINLALGELHVRPMDIVVVILEAHDNNNIDGPGITMAEPLIIEVPIPEDDADTGADGDSNEGNGSAQEINPLLLQRQLYRDTLRVSMRLRSTHPEQLAEQQREIHEHLILMQQSDLAHALGDQFMDLLVTAAHEAERAAHALLPTTTHRGRVYQQPTNYNASLDHQAAVLDALLEAARIQQEWEPEESTPEDGEDMDEPEGDEEAISYTLISEQTAESEGESEAAEEERIARALLALEEALEQQQQLNLELEQAGDHATANDSTPFDETTGEPLPGDANGSPQDASTASLAERQRMLQETSLRIQQQIERLQQTQSGADPQLAAEQMRRAAIYQHEAAEAILAQALEEALTDGIRSEDALQRAMVLTESLLDHEVAARIEAQSHAHGYQNLIRNYSRRLSYDQ